MTQNDPQGRPMAPQSDPLGIENHVKKCAFENYDFLIENYDFCGTQVHLLAARESENIISRCPESRAMRGIDVGMNFEKSKNQNFRLKNHDFQYFGSPSSLGLASCRRVASLPAGPGPRLRDRPVPPIDGGVEALDLDLPHTF